MVGQPKYVVAIDQGTTSSRAILFDLEGRPAFVSQKEFPQHYPKPGWAEHDPMEILASVQDTLASAMEQAGATATDVAAIGITNQRETTVAWDRETGKPLHNALVWLDLRTAEVSERLQSAGGGQDCFRATTGLPVSTYFSAVKMKWLIENSPAVAKAVEQGRCAFGTIDSWLIYNLTGGTAGGTHATDVTNASRYLLMDLKSLSWNTDVCNKIGIPIAALPEIRSSAEDFGAVVTGPLAGVHIAGVLGDQHAALLGQGCLDVGEVKSTYGTGCFIVMNTGAQPIHSKHGLLTTLAYKLGRDAPTTYALEGSVATAGRGIQWLRDSLKLIEAAPEIGPLADSVQDTGGVTFVPAFSGLLAPHWRPDARAALVGMSLHTTNAHVCRAMLEGISFQACDVMTAMESDAATEVRTLKVDGGLTASEPAMQIQANLLGKSLLRAQMPEATALGAAFAAGLSVGTWRDPTDIRAILERAGGAARFEPKIGSAARGAAFERWRDAMQRSLNLAEVQQREAAAAGAEASASRAGGGGKGTAPPPSLRLGALIRPFGRLLRRH